MTPSLKADLKHYFKSYSTSNACYVTSDSMIFHKELDARSHANDTRKDGQVAEFTRDHIESLPGDSGEGSEKTDYSKLTKEKLQAELQSREIAFDEKANKAALIALLEAADAPGATEDDE